MHRLQDLVRLRRMDTGAREVAWLLGMSPNTERVYREALEKAGVLAEDANELPVLEELRAAIDAAKPPAPQPQQVSSVERWAEVATKLVMDRRAGAKAVYDYLKVNEPEFTGCLRAVKRLVQRIKKARGVTAADVATTHSCRGA